MSGATQSPFVTLFMELDPKDEYIDEVSEIIDEILRQRIIGIKDEHGVYVTPAFPKLIFVLDENNIHPTSKYYSIKLRAAECIAKRMVPDLISAKKMRELYDGEVFSCMGCRSFLSLWRDEDGKYKWEGRFNQGVVSINLPQIGILAQGDDEKFFSMLDERLELCKEALMCRHEALKGTLSDVSPIHWQHGAIARLKPGETIDKYLMGGYSTISLGYIGLYEVTRLMRGVSHTDADGQKFALKVMHILHDKTELWKEETGLGFGVYGTPAESLCYRFARIDEELYGHLIPDEMREDITGKGYYTNSYHVDVREEITAFEKFSFESEFQDLSSGGAISYCEVPNMVHNIEAVLTLMDCIYNTTKYGEINTRSDICLDCGYEGEIKAPDGIWTCPCCGNTDNHKMVITRRTCGYIGSYLWNVGKTKEINWRVLHM